VLKFGTDGVRGVANGELTPELALALGRAAVRVLGGARWGVGRDTRLSGPMLEAAFAAGVTSEGADVVSLGVAPTPEVAWWSVAEDAPAAMISASHNPFADNGIKVFAPGGRKLSDAAEERLEAELDRLVGDRPSGPADVAGAAPESGADTEAGADAGTGAGAVAGTDRERPGQRPVGEAVGTVTATSVHDRYGDAVAASIEGRRLDGLRVVVDCANGAATVVAPDVLRRLGADVEVLHSAPDGTNINDGCGSTHPGDLQAAVPAIGADLGVAFDGDADRVLLVDGDGKLVDGDHIIAICAADLAARGRLPGDAVVVTVMTNLGFRLAMGERGIRVVETKVGDRYVLEALESGDYALGGEQSGHVIFRRLATTGDGLLTAVQVLDVVVRSGQALGKLAGEAMTRLPQVLRNVRVAAGRAGVVAERLRGDVAAVEAELGDTGRVLVRPSGTEPLLRIMVEAPTAGQAEAAVTRLVAAAEAHAAP
jgi:phosphoglucosamine mutase